MKIYDARGYAVGTVRERVLTFLPKFEMYLGDRYMGCVRKRFSFFRPVFDLDCNGWQVEGDWFEWDYDIRSARGARVATISKQLFRWSDTYVIDVADPNHALCALMVVLAIDAEKCSRNSRFSDKKSRKFAKKIRKPLAIREKVCYNIFCVPPTAACSCGMMSKNIKSNERGKLS